MRTSSVDSDAGAVFHEIPPHTFNDSDYKIISLVKVIFIFIKQIFFSPFHFLFTTSKSNLPKPPISTIIPQSQELRHTQQFDSRPLPAGCPSLNSPEHTSFAFSAFDITFQNPMKTIKEAKTITISSSTPLYKYSRFVVCAFAITFIAYFLNSVNISNTFAIGPNTNDTKTDVTIPLINTPYSPFLEHDALTSNKQQFQNMLLNTHILQTRLLVVRTNKNILTPQFDRMIEPLEKRLGLLESRLTLEYSEKNLLDLTSIKHLYETALTLIKNDQLLIDATHETKEHYKELVVKLDNDQAKAISEEFINQLSSEHSPFMNWAALSRFHQALDTTYRQMEKK